MQSRRVDIEYLAWQYGDAEKLRARIEAHRLYSERGGDFREWLIEHAAIAPGMTVLDAGCGPGTYHALIAGRGARIVASDLSAGMLREARAQATAQRLPVAALAADVQALPLRTAAFDRAMANHVLYHVPDRERALRELRRVLKPGGRAVLATNAADNGGRLHGLHEEAAREHGFTPAPLDSLRFTLDDLPLARSVFPSARVFVREDALVFPDAAAALRYYASYQVDSIDERPADGSHRPRLLASMERRISEIVAREGVFRAQKDAGCFVADV